MSLPSRREVLRLAASGCIAASAGQPLARALWQPLQVPGDRPAPCEQVQVLNPRARVPVSLIIDDSTCLVNLAHFAIPQFAEVFPDQYQQDWRQLPREIPDQFVRKFAAWCRDHQVRGKYSVVPYPACVGWVSHSLPGWSKSELQASLELIRHEIVPDWDIHPEMVTHTWAIDLQSGRPFPEHSERFMENWGFSRNRSVDELAAYMGFALSILKDAGLRCEGITTPGGFGNAVLPELSQAVFESVRDAFSVEIPHYFRHLFTDDQSVAPRVEYARGLNGPNPGCVVSIVGCTGDWFGDWDGLTLGSPDLFIDRTGKQGRLPQVIAREEPAVMVCHWPGLYCNGSEAGFQIFQEVVRRLEMHHDNLIWMRLSDLARYWAARELTAMRPQIAPGNRVSSVQLDAPFATRAFTIGFEPPPAHGTGLVLLHNGQPMALEPVASTRQLQPFTYCTEQNGRLVACFDLPSGRSTLALSPKSDT